MRLCLLFFIFSTSMFAAHVDKRYSVEKLQRKLSTLEMGGSFNETIHTLESLLKFDQLSYFERIEYKWKLQQACERLSLKEKLFALEADGSHDEIIDVSRSLLKYQTLSFPERSEYKQKQKRAQEALIYQGVSKLFDDPSEELLLIVESYSKGCDSYAQAKDGTCEHIFRVMAHFNGQENVPHIVFMYWFNQLVKHKEESSQDLVRAALKESCSEAYNQVKHHLPKYALLLQQRDNARLGNEVMPVHQFIQVYTDKRWMKSMHKYAKEIAPETFIKAQKNDPAAMLTLGCTFEENGMPCSAMYWFDQAVETEDVGAIADFKRQALYQDILK